ncbi:MAG: type III-B CRISPR-associated protein Cas10/Cmr2 [Candidatus Rokubacteria bacterium]|nr:type III-B CRISPR-associated protein Cas10/Cmr2 [Candidatus Rokubacteria bacterium]
MDRELAEKKIEALLHDPPGKAPTLWYRSHEAFSAGLIELVLGRPPRHEEVVRKADRLASAVDRVVLRDPVSYRVDFLREPVIAHTLSGTPYRLASLTNERPEHFEAEQRGVLERLVHDAGGKGSEPERFYWYVWRGLEPALRARGEVGKLWSYLPADTRVPDHGIWDHMRVTAAFAGALPEPALVLFSFGPVQPLIEAARRTGDLWAGSFLLSWLAWSAMRDLVTELGADAVLFPDLFAQPLVDGWLREQRGWNGIPGLAERRGGSPVASLPNRFLALVPSASAERLARASEAGLRAAAAEFVRGGAGGLAGSDQARADEWGERAVQQAARTFACHWFVQPWVTDPADLRRLSLNSGGTSMALFWETMDALAQAQLYRPNLGSHFAAQSALVEVGHAATKATRRFSQIDERGSRCTVCGVQEALWTRDAERPAARASGVRRGERLCGLCAARRLAPKSAWAEREAGRTVIFPSTHNLAAGRFFREVLDCLRGEGRDGGKAPEQSIVDAVRLVVDAAGEGDRQAYATPALMRAARQCGRHADLAEAFVKLPAELLDPATLDPQQVRDGAPEELGFNPAAAARLRQALTALREARRAAGIQAPRKYYGVLVMDGDRMGQWLAGERAPEIREVLHPGARPLEAAVLLSRRRPLSMAHQIAVSRALNQFSLDIVGPVIEQVHGGVVVYAGGDDALAMLPLDSVLPCLRDLRRLYSGLPLAGDSLARGDGWESERGHVRRGDRLWRVMGERATSSTGVAIAHEKWPLRHALQTAREMERLAKDGLGRNAVAIAVLRRSGGHERFAARWGEEDMVRDPDPLAVLEEVATVIGRGLVSRRFAYALREEARVLWSLGEALAERAFWLLQRHRRRDADGLEDGRMKKAALGLQDLATWLTATPQRAPFEEAGPPGLDRFVAGVGLAEFIARGGEAGE